MSMKQYFKSYDHETDTSILSFTFCPKCGAKLEKKEIDAALRNYCPNCRYVQYINPLPGVSVLIEKDRNVLIGKRANQNAGSDQWCLPCGFVEYHETYLEAAHREVLEETGLKIIIQSLINVTSNHIRPELHSLVPVLLATVAGGKTRPGDDLIALEWFSENDTLPEMAFEADEFIIKMYFDNKIHEIPVDPRFKFNMDNS